MKVIKMNLNIEQEIKDYLIRNILAGKIKNGHQINDIKFFTALFKVNPNFVKNALASLQKEGFIKKVDGGYKVIADDLKIETTRINYTNKYINDLVEKCDEIGVPLDQVIEVLKLRNMANG